MNESVQSNFMQQLFLRTLLAIWLDPNIKQTLYLIQMKQRTKISIDEVKYIQTQIEKILNIYSPLQNLNNTLPLPKKDKVSALTTNMYRNQQQSRKLSKTTYAPYTISKKDAIKKNITHSPSKSSQKSNKKLKTDSQLKLNTKKQQNDQSYNKLEKKKVVVFSPELQNINPTQIIEQRPNLQNEKQKKQINPIKDSTKQTQFSARQFQRNMIFFQKRVTKSDYLQSQRLINQKQSSSNLNKQIKNQSPSISQQKIKSSSKKGKNSQIKKRYFPHGLSEIVKKKKSATDSIASAEILYTLTKQQKKPYYLNNKNVFPLRNDEDYLQRKFKQKKQRKKKKQDLILKYHVLDQRLNKLRQQIQIQPKAERIQRIQGRQKMKQKKQYREALRTYLRYSPLNKLLKRNEKMKTQYEKSISSSSKKMTLNQKIFKELFEDGRSIWNS